MRILACTNLYPNPFQPTRATFNRRRMRLLSERNGVQVIAPISWTDEWHVSKTGTSPLPQTRRVKLDGLTVDHPKYWYTPKCLRGAYGHFFEASVKATFNRAVDEFRPDIVLAPWAYPDGWAAVRLAHRRGLPAVVLVHGSDVRYSAQFAGREAKTAEALRNADGVVAVSRDLAERCIQMGASVEKVIAIQDGIDKRVFYPGNKVQAQAALGFDANRMHLLYVGNLVDVKGVDVLLNACGKLSTTDVDWVLHVVGAGPLKHTLSSQAQMLGIGNRVIFHGLVLHNDLPRWFQAADLFVLASRSEGIPCVLLEAAACHLPFVATNVGGVPEISHLGASLLVPPESSDELASAIQELLAAPSSQPSVGPRDHREAAAELERFLTSTVGARHDLIKHTTVAA
jgi:glycosyltransferase involved in cell wall biosynthesis